MEQRRNPYATARSATGLTALSTLSPFAGLTVEMALAWRFGASATVDAFRIAALLVLFGQQLFTVQIFPNIIVPLFAEYRGQGKEREAWRVALSLANILLIPASIVALFFFIWPGPVVNLLGPGLDPEARGTATFFVRWFVLTIVPLIWTGVMTSVFYAQGIFWLPAASQLLGNVVLVVVILMFGRTLGPASLVAGTVLASIGSWTLYMARLVPLIRQAEVRTAVSINPGHPGVRKALGLALPLLGLVAVAQWNAIVINRVLSELPVGTLATFGFAWKMGQLVLLVPAALGTVLFTRFSESWRSSSDGEFPEVCNRALRMALFIALPLTCIFFVLRVPVVVLLFQRGELSAEAGEMTARLFGLLLLGAPASVAYFYLQKMFYAVQETWIPTWTQLAGALFLTIAAPLFAASLGADGVALASVVLSWMSGGSLLLILARRYKGIRIKPLGILAMEILPLAVASGWLGGEIGKVLGRFVASNGLALSVTVASGAPFGVVIFYGATLLLRFPEALQGQRYFEWQGGVMLRKVQSAIRR